MISRYLTFVNFTFRKLVLHDKIITTTRATKNQQNSAFGFGDNYLSNILVKFLQDRIGVGQSELLE